MPPITMRTSYRIGHFLTVLLIVPGTCSWQSQQEIGLPRVEALVKSRLGPRVTVSSDVSPSFLVGDFDADGHRDVAVTVDIDSELKRLIVSGTVVKSLFSESLPILPKGSEGHNCLGILVFEGVSPSLKTVRSEAYFYGCFSGWRTLPKGKMPESRGERGLMPSASPRGDSIILDLENGALMLLYKSESGFKGKYLRTEGSPPK